MAWNGPTERSLEENYNFAFNFVILHGLEAVMMSFSLTSKNNN
jgi:hypothetical protein